MTDDQVTPSDVHRGARDGRPAEIASPPSGVSRATLEKTGKTGVEGGTDAETEVWSGRTHWKHYSGRLIVWLVGNLAFIVLASVAARRLEWLTVGGALWGILGFVLVSGVLVVGRVAVVILSRRYCVTSQRLFVERGILTQTTDQTELIRVDDVRLRKTVVDRIFGLGTVQVSSTDASDRELLIEGIAEPEKVSEAIRTHMRNLRRSSLYIENL